MALTSSFKDFPVELIPMVADFIATLTLTNIISITLLEERDMRTAGDG